MDCIVTYEGRLVLRDGRPASHHATYERVWKRYLDVFDSVTVISRVFPVEQAAAAPVEGPGVNVLRLPPFSGGAEYMAQLPAIRRRMRAAAARDAAFILTVPGAGVLWTELRRANRPYAVEVVGDPYDVFAPGAIRHPLRAGLRRWYRRHRSKM